MKSVYRLCRIGDDGKQKVVAKLARRAPGLYAQLRHERGSPRAHRVPPGGQPARAQVLGQALHPELSLGAGARAGVSISSRRTQASWCAPRPPTPSFAFHHVNAFADRDRLAVDVITYPDATIIDQLYLARLRSSAPLTATGTLTRFHVPFAGDAPVTRRILADVPLELPRINYEAPRRQALSLCLGHRRPDQRRLSRFHRQDRYRNRHGRHLARWRGFIRASRSSCPRRPPTAEDDGVLLSVVLDIDKDRSFLLVLDAASLDGAGAGGRAARHPLPFPRQLLPETEAPA